MACYYYFARRIEIIAGVNDQVRFDFSGTRSANLTPGVYYVTGLGDADDFLQHLVDRMGAADGGTYAFEYSIGITGDALVGGKANHLKINRSGGLNWAFKTGETTAPIKHLFGFENVLGTAAPSQTSDFTCAGTWAPTEPASVENPGGHHNGNTSVSVSGRSYSLSKGPLRKSLDLTFPRNDAERVSFLHAIDQRATYDSFREHVGGGIGFRAYRFEVNAYPSIRTDQNPEHTLVGEFTLENAFDSMVHPRHSARHAEFAVSMKLRELVA